LQDKEQEQEEEKHQEESGKPVPGPISRVLVFLDGDQPIKYPLYKEVMTIGRSDQADIQVTGDFISRVHARLVSTQDGVTIEDVNSKNGIKVNSELTGKRQLKHGDVLALGKLRFTFIDTVANRD
jgi:pSer/pThr/pTyr-binding forkhead associated (FHA) protein